MGNASRHSYRSSALSIWT